MCAAVTGCVPDRVLHWSGSGKSPAVLVTNAGVDLGFYKIGCPIHLKGAPLSAPNYFDPYYQKQTIFWPQKK